LNSSMLSLLRASRGFHSAPAATMLAPRVFEKCVALYVSSGLFERRLSKRVLDHPMTDIMTPYS